MTHEFPVVCLIHYDKHELADPPAPHGCDQHRVAALNFYTFDEAEEWLRKELAFVAGSAR